MAKLYSRALRNHRHSQDKSSAANPSSSPPGVFTESRPPRHTVVVVVVVVVLRGESSLEQSAFLSKNISILSSPSLFLLLSPAEDLI